jgi:nucleoside-diphosphate-sugar epimerase
VLVLGGTGAMGVYLVPELAAMGCDVTVVSCDDVVSADPHLIYIKADATNKDTLRALHETRFDATVDFMIYSTEAFRERIDLLLQNTGHYVFLSSYRVYAGSETPVTETTPRLLDASTDTRFLSTEDYALYKAREEDLLRNSSYNHWTIVRPAITYSKRRFQLVTLEAPVVIARAMKRRPVVLPKQALAVQATMSWAGDVAKMLSRLLFKPHAQRECFTVATAEHHTWGEVADYYKEILGLECVAVDTDDYLKILGSSDVARYQLMYDRLFDRIIDNSKVLRVTGLTQAELMPLRRGLEKELSALPEDTIWPSDNGIGNAMDDYLKSHGC